MDINASRYFNINRIFMMVFGLWPYQNSRTKFVHQALAMLTMSLMLLPQMLSVYKNYGNYDKIFENLPVIIAVFALMSKLITTALAERKLKLVFDTIVVNFNMITDDDERIILVKYSERGRLLTLTYIVYVSASLVLFVMLPLTPAILDQVLPQNESRHLMFIFNGEFLIDHYVHYKRIYLFDILMASVSVGIFITFDTSFAVCVEHGLGLFSIVKFRLRNCTQHSFKTSDQTLKDISYDFIIKTIELHNEAIRYANIVQQSFSWSFLVLVGMNLIHLSCTSILIIIKMNEKMEFIRLIMILIGAQLHLFFLSWPGQKLIDHSTELFRESYNNEWYECSIKSQKTLQLLTIRAMKPCQLSAGGLFVMNFENFLKVSKMSVSYMTLFSSFR